MNIVFFGTSEFAVSILKALVESKHKVKCVITQPPKKKGRGLKVSPQPVEVCVKELKLKTGVFKDINSKETTAFLKEQKADIFVVVAFGQILSKQVLSVPELYSINVHASLLPKYRGAAPIQWALINGEKETGVTIMKMNELLDKGDIAARRSLKIGDDEHALSLSKRLSLLGAELLIDTLDKIESNDISFIPQDENIASYAPKLNKEDGLVDWNKDAISIRNLIRGCYPWPSAYTYLDKKLLKILEAETAAGTKDITAGSIIEINDKGISVACKGSSLILRRLQLEGRSPLSAEEFLRGRPLKKDEVLG